MKLKEKLTEKNLLYFFIFVLVATTLGDLFTAIRLPIFEIAETNPLYLITGNVFPLVFLNILSIIWISRNLKNSISISKIFIVSMLVVYLSIAHGVGMWSNITAGQQYQQDPQGFVQDVQAISPREKATAYGLVIGVIMIMPIIISFIAFQIALFFYTKRLPKREKIMLEIYELSKRMYTK